MYCDNCGEEIRRSYYEFLDGTVLCPACLKEFWRGDGEDGMVCGCGEPLYDSKYEIPYYNINGVLYCEDCIEDFRKELY